MIDKKVLKNFILRSYEDLFSKVEQRPSLDEMCNVIEPLEIEGFMGRNAHPLDLPNRKMEAYLGFLRLYKNKSFISSLRYSLSIVSVYVYLGMKFLYLFFKNRYQLCFLTDAEVNYPRVQFNRGSQNVSSCFFPEEKLPFIDCTYKKISLSLGERVQLLSLALEHKCWECWNIAQFVSLDTQLKKINIKSDELVIEEGGDYTVSAFVFLTKDRFKKKTLTVRTPNIYTNYPNYGFDQIITNTKLIHAALLKKNKNVLLVPKFPDLKISLKTTSGKIKAIGYFPDMGDFLLNRVDKLKYDSFLRVFSREKAIPLRLTIHPQEFSLRIKEYEKFFKGLNVAYRQKENESMDEFLDKVDVIVGWWSTVAFQSFCKRVPIILLDFFGDNQGIEFEKLGNGMILRARTEEEFENIFDRLSAMSIEEKNLKFDKAFLNFFNLNQ